MGGVGCLCLLVCGVGCLWGGVLCVGGDVRVCLAWEVCVRVFVFMYVWVLCIVTIRLIIVDIIFIITIIISIIIIQASSSITLS